MARRGQVIENPRIGQRGEFVETAADNGGERLVADFTSRPGYGVGRHFHVRQTERFDLLEGEIVLTVDGETHRLRAGDSFTIPPRVVHAFEVTSAGPARILTEFRPAGHAAEVFVGTFAIDTRYENGGTRLRRLVEAARLARDTEPDFFWLPRFPWWLQAAVLRAIARLADLRPSRANVRARRSSGGQAPRDRGRRRPRRPSGAVR